MDLPSKTLPLCNLYVYNNEWSLIALHSALTAAASLGAHLCMLLQDSEVVLQLTAAAEEAVVLIQQGPHWGNPSLLLIRYSWVKEERAAETEQYDLQHTLGLRSML